MGLSPRRSPTLPCISACLGAEEPLLERRIAELEQLAHAEAGQEFSLDSPQEVGGLCVGTVGPQEQADSHCSHITRRPHLSAACSSHGWFLTPSLSAPAWICPCACPPQVSQVLFEVLKIPPPPCAKTLKSGGYSTGQEVR